MWFDVPSRLLEATDHPGAITANAESPPRPADRGADLRFFGHVGADFSMSLLDSTANPDR
jgi:hypothetical protein